MALAFFALAEEDQKAPVPGEAIELYDSLWGEKRAAARIEYADGLFYVGIETSDHGSDWTMRRYLCVYDGGTQTLRCEGCGEKYARKADRYDTTDAKTLYENGSAVFFRKQPGPPGMDGPDGGRGQGPVFDRRGRRPEAAG